MEQVHQQFGFQQMGIRVSISKMICQVKKAKKNSKIFSPLPVAYVNIKKKINLTRKL